MNTQHANQFGVVYGLLAFVLLVAGFGAWKGYTYETPKPDPTVAHKADVKAVAGQQNLVYLCEASITQSINSHGGKVTGYSHPTQKPDGPHKVKVSVSVGSDIFTGRLSCSFEKSNWQLGQVAPVA